MLFVMQSDMKRQKKTLEKCSEEKLNNDLPKDLFFSLESIRPKLMLELNYQNFEKQCFLINKILMQEKYFFQIYEPRKKSRYLINTTSQ